MFPIPELELLVGSVSSVGGGSAAIVSGNGNGNTTLRVTNAALLKGETWTVNYVVRVSKQIIPGASVSSPNNASLTWSTSTNTAVNASRTTTIPLTVATSYTGWGKAPTFATAFVSHSIASTTASITFLSTNIGENLTLSHTINPIEGTNPIKVTISQRGAGALNLFGFVESVSSALSSPVLRPYFSFNGTDLVGSDSVLDTLVFDFTGASQIINTNFMGGSPTPQSAVLKFSIVAPDVVQIFFRIIGLETASKFVFSL